MNWEAPAYANLIGPLAEACRVLAFDKRGTGLSSRDLGFGSMADRADDIRAVMDACDWPEAHLFGMSEGGPLVGALRRHPPGARRELLAVRHLRPGHAGARLSSGGSSPRTARRSRRSSKPSGERAQALGHPFVAHADERPDLRDRPLRAERVHAEDGRRDHAPEHRDRRSLAAPHDSGAHAGRPRRRRSPRTRGARPFPGRAHRRRPLRRAPARDPREHARRGLRTAHRRPDRPCARQAGAGRERAGAGHRALHRHHRLDANGGPARRSASGAGCSTATTPNRSVASIASAAGW